MVAPEPLPERIPAAAPDAIVDNALVMGPLYHLISNGDRRAALNEAHRVLVRGR